MANKNTPAETVTAATASKNPFDFADLSDLPEDLQSKLPTETSDAAQEYADVVKAGKDAGFDELNINQIMAAATRMGIKVPTQQTVRGYLNKAKKLGLLDKPTRQTYAVPAGKKTRTKAEGTGLEDAVAVADAPVEDTTDPLAGL